MYESVISHPPEEWEVVPSIDVRVGERLKEEYPDPAERPVININVEAATFALRQVQRSDAAPTIVSLMLQEGIKRPHKSAPKYVGGTALGRGWGSDIRINSLNPVTQEPRNLEAIQVVTVHELKHAADYNSPSARLADKEYQKTVRGFRNKLRLTWEVVCNNFLAKNGGLIDAYPNYSGLAALEKPRQEMTVGEYIYRNSPAEIVAYGTEEQAQKLPSIITFDKPKKKKK